MSIDALFASPLLGRARQRALHQAGTLAMALLDAPDPVAEARLLAWGALHAQIARAPDADRLLLDAMGRCARLGRPVESIRCGLAFGRALAQKDDPALAARRALPHIEAAADHPSLAGDAALTEAFVELGDVRDNLGRALALLPSPARDHDRLEAHLRLGEALRAGGDRSRAEPQLLAAWELAQRHEDGPGIVHTGVVLAGLRLSMGQRAAARPIVQAASRWASADALAAQALGTVAIALAIEAEDWAEVEQQADQIEAAACARQSPLGRADAGIARSVARCARGEATAAVQGLLVLGGALAEEGHAAALNLVKARLGELRSQMGAEAFDPLLGA